MGLASKTHPGWHAPPCSSVSSASQLLVQPCAAKPLLTLTGLSTTECNCAFTSQCAAAAADNVAAPVTLTCSVLCRAALCCAVLCGAALHLLQCTVLYCTVPYCTCHAPNCFTLTCSVLCCAVLHQSYCNVLCCAVLYRTVHVTHLIASLFSCRSPAAAWHVGV